MQTHRTPDIALWDQYRVLGEQSTHEDTLVNHRVGWLILSEGLLFTAYGAEAASAANWPALALPVFGIVVAALIGAATHAALATSEDVRLEFQQAGLADLCGLAPERRLALSGRRAPKLLPFAFASMWLLAFASSLRG